MGVSYKSEVGREALDFIVEHDEMVVQGIVDEADWDRNQLGGLDSAFHESITDRAYTSNDALWVLQNCENEETDSGLWEGTDMEDALQVKAAYSFSNDVWFACQEIYNDIAEAVDDANKLIDYYAGGLKDCSITASFGSTKLDLRLIYSDADGTGEKVYVATASGGDEFAGVAIRTADGALWWASMHDGKVHVPDQRGPDAASLAVALSAFAADGALTDADIEQAFRRALARREIAGRVANDAPTPVEPGSEEERRLVVRWLRMGDAIGMRSGHPLGGAYIDSRCGVGYGMPDQLEYVRFDEEIRRRVPHLAGKHSQEVRDYLRETFGAKAPETAEEALVQVRGLIDDRAPGEDFYEMAEDIDRVLGAAPKP